MDEFKQNASIKRLSRKFGFETISNEKEKNCLSLDTNLYKLIKPL